MGNTDVLRVEFTIEVDGCVTVVESRLGHRGHSTRMAALALSLYEVDWEQSTLSCLARQEG